MHVLTHSSVKRSLRPAGFCADRPRNLGVCCSLDGGWGAVPAGDGQAQGGPAHGACSACCRHHVLHGHRGRHSPCAGLQHGPPGSVQVRVACRADASAVSACMVAVMHEGSGLGHDQTRATSLHVLDRSCHADECVHVASHPLELSLCCSRLVYVCILRSVRVVVCRWDPEATAVRLDELPHKRLTKPAKVGQLCCRRASVRHVRNPSAPCSSWPALLSQRQGLTHPGAESTQACSCPGIRDKRCTWCISMHWYGKHGAQELEGTACQRISERRSWSCSSRGPASLAPETPCSGWTPLPRAH